MHCINISFVLVASLIALSSTTDASVLLAKRQTPPAAFTAAATLPAFRGSNGAFAPSTPPPMQGGPAVCGCQPAYSSPPRRGPSFGGALGLPSRRPPPRRSAYPSSFPRPQGAAAQRPSSPVFPIPIAASHYPTSPPSGALNSQATAPPFMGPRPRTMPTFAAGGSSECDDDSDVDSYNDRNYPSRGGPGYPSTYGGDSEDDGDYDEEDDYSYGNANGYGSGSNNSYGNSHGYNYGSEDNYNSNHASTYGQSDSYGMQSNAGYAGGSGAQGYNGSGALDYDADNYGYNGYGGGAAGGLDNSTYSYESDQSSQSNQSQSSSQTVVNADGTSHTYTAAQRAAQEAAAHDSGSGFQNGFASGSQSASSRHQADSDAQLQTEQLVGRNGSTQSQALFVADSSQADSDKKSAEYQDANGNAFDGETQNASQQADHALQRQSSTTSGNGGIQNGSFDLGDFM